MKAWIVAAVLVLAAAGGYLLFIRGQMPGESAVLAEAKRGFAACVKPSAPSAAPDGATATKEQMLAARRAATDFDTATTAYTGCLKAVEQPIHNAYQFSATADVQKVSQLMTERNNAAIDLDQKVANQVNEEIRKFKARNP